MSTTTKILTGAATLAVAASLAGSAALADRWNGYGYGWGRPNVLPRVAAVGASINPAAARMQAVHNWRDKVANRYGFQYSRWFAARNKDVNCVRVADDDPSWDTYGSRSLKRPVPRHYDPVTRCTVSANPALGFMGYYGFNY
jgi:hypothetical protein